MREYKLAFLLLCLCFSILPIFMIAVGALSGASDQQFFWGAVLAGIWLVAVIVFHGSKFAFWFSFAATAIVGGLLLYQIGKRISFIVIYGGMDRPDEPGSPMAFLIGFAGELFLFAPAALVLIAGIGVMFGGGKKAGEDA